MGWPTEDQDAIERLGLFGPDEFRAVSPAEFTERARRVEAVFPEVTGCVRPGMSFGVLSELPLRGGRPATAAVLMANLAEVLVSTAIAHELVGSGLVAEEDFVRANTLARPGGLSFRELRIPFGGALDDETIAAAGPGCSVCGRRAGMRWQHRISESAMVGEERPTFRLADWQNVVLVREDLAALFRSFGVPLLGFEPVEVVRGRRAPDPRRRVLAYDVAVADAFVAGARSAHELMHGAHLLSEARRNIADLVVEPLLRVYPAWEVPRAFDLTPCWPPLLRAGKRALGVDGPVVLTHEDPNYDRAAWQLRNAVMGIGAGWGKAARYAGRKAGDLLPRSVSGQDLQHWASDWLDVRYVEASGLPEETTRAVRERFEAGDTRGVEKGAEGGRFVLGRSVLKSRQHGAVLPRSRVREDEDLDALRFVRRFGLLPVSALSTSRVAIQPWLEQLREGELATLHELAEATCMQAFLAQCTRWSDSYRWDAELLFRERWSELASWLVEQKGSAGTWPTEALEALIGGREPDPHVALVVAVVDRAIETDDALKAWALGGFDAIEGATGIVLAAAPHELIALVPVTRLGRATEALRAGFPGPGAALALVAALDRFDAWTGDLYEAARGVARSDASRRDGAVLVVAARDGGGWTTERLASVARLDDEEGGRGLSNRAIATIVEGAHRAVRRARELVAR